MIDDMQGVMIEAENKQLRASLVTLMEAENKHLRDTIVVLQDTIKTLRELRELDRKEIASLRVLIRGMDMDVPG